MAEKKRGQVHKSKNGIVLIFNNQNFSDYPFRERHGSNDDVTRISKTFNYQNYNIAAHINCTVDDFRLRISEYATRDYSDVDCFICFIMSISVNGKILGSDSNEIDMYEFVDPLKENDSLLNKPKLFFINAESENNFSIYRPDTNISNRDFLLSLYVETGFRSYRNQTSGSVYIQTLCDVIDERNDSTDIFHVLMEVNRRMIARDRRMPSFVNSLTMPFYLCKRN